MILNLRSRIKLFFNPPKPGDVFWTDSFTYVAGRPFEQVMHGLRNINGDAVWEPIYGEQTCRMKISPHDDYDHSYYLVQCEILAFNKNTQEKGWFLRIRPRRIDKKSFNEMIVLGEVEKDGNVV